MTRRILSGRVCWRGPCLLLWGALVLSLTAAGCSEPAGASGEDEAAVTEMQTPATPAPVTTAPVPVTTPGPGGPAGVNSMPPGDGASSGSAGDGAQNTSPMPGPGTPGLGDPSMPGGDGPNIASPVDSGSQAVPAGPADSGMDEAPDDPGREPPGPPADDRCDVAVHDPSAPPGVMTLSGNLGTHDPTVIEQDGVFYEFQTGPRIPGKTSTDLMRWEGTDSALGRGNPSWIAGAVPGARDLWAPDISLFNGQYHLYYSASTFGSNTSCIGHATRESLATGAWMDHGSVICSRSSDRYNAIDPNLIVDEEGTAWLVFGSFWDGIKAIELDAAGARANDELHSLASRGGGAIEAPVVVRRCGYYYLFVSFDRCCDGANSTYNIRVGRSEAVLGPYVDREGTSMMAGGGTQIVAGDSTWRGPGHNAVIFHGERAYNIYHAYAARNGAPNLRVAELVWDADGWPVSGGP